MPCQNAREERGWREEIPPTKSRDFFFRLLFRTLDSSVVLQLAFIPIETMPAPLPPPPLSPSRLHGLLFDFIFAFVHSSLTFAVTLVRKDWRRPKARQCRQNDDLEQAQVGYSPSESYAMPSSSFIEPQSFSIKAPASRKPQQQHHRICSGKKSVQFELPKRASPPLGRIDILSASSIPPKSESKSQMCHSLDILWGRASNPRVHHAAYFLD